MQSYCKLDTLEQTSVKLKSKYKHFIKDMHWRNVACKIWDISHRPKGAEHHSRADHSIRQNMMITDNAREDLWGPVTRSLGFKWEMINILP